MKNHILSWPGYRVAWDMLKQGMQPDFREYVDGLARGIPETRSSDRTETWRKLTTERRQA